MPAKSFSPAWLALGTPVFLVILLGAMLPPWEFDTREYHLQVPKEWFRQGRIDFLPHNVYGNMPLGAEMHPVLAMGLMPGERSWWWGALAGKTVMAAFAPLTALGLFAAGRRFFSPLAGVLAAVVYIAIPWIAHNAVTGMNDHVLACYVFLAFYALLLWRGQREPASLLILSGVLTGAAAACKYTGLLFAGAPLGLLAIYFALRPRREATDPSTPASSSPRHILARVPLIACGFALAAALSGGLWYAQNVVQAGNPVYPLLYEVFGGRTWTPEKAARWNRAHQVPRSAEVGPYAPQRLMHSVAEVGWRSEWLSPVLVPLLLLAPLQRRNRWAVAWTAGMTFFLLAAWWLATHRIDRFWIPALPTAALLAGAGAAWVADRGWGKAMLGLAAAGVAANFLIVASPWIGDNRFLVALEALRTDAVDPVTRRWGRVNRAHHWLNENVAEGSAVLLVGDAQVFDLEPRAYYNTCFDSCLFEKVMKGRSPEERRAALEEKNITQYCGEKSPAIVHRGTTVTPITCNRRCSTSS
jgi:hypothetical protein